MHVTILGASRFGVATTRQLIADGHDVVLIDTDRARLDELAEDLDCGMIHGDGTLPSVLRDAFGDGADALVALTNEDNVNLLASVVGLSVGYPRVIPQIVRPELLSITDELGLDESITPHESVARDIVAALEQHSEVEATPSLRHDLRIVTVHVPDTAEPRSWGDVSLPENIRPIARIRGEAEALVDADTSLEPGDCLLLVAPPDALDAIMAVFPRDPQTQVRERD